MVSVLHANLISCRVGFMLTCFNKRNSKLFCPNESRITTGSPSSKYKHRRTSALLRDIQSVRICMGKKPIVSVTYENERITIKNSLPLIKSHGPEEFRVNK